MKKIRKILPKIVCVIFLISLPVILAFIYKIPIKQVLPLELDSLLSYYGALLGVFGALYIFKRESDEKENRRKLDMYNELKPQLDVLVLKRKDRSYIYDITIKNYSQNPVRCIYFYGIYLTDVIYDRFDFSVSFCQIIEKQKELDVECHICEPSDIIDCDSYPKYVQVYCDDKLGNQWECDFNKIKDGDNIYYYPNKISITQ